MKRLCAGASLLFSICAGAGVPTIDLSRDAQERIGLTTTILEPRTEQVTVSAYARALDAGPLAALDAEIESARANAQSSRSESSRLAELVKSDLAASVRAAETAEAQARNDQARLTLAERRLSLEWTPALRDVHTRTTLLEAITQGRSTLIRVDIPGWAGETPSRFDVAIPNRDTPVTARLIGRATAADALLQAPAFLVVVDGPDAVLLPVGVQVRASMAIGAVESGFMLPRSALLRWRGGVWAYVQSAEGAFERRAVSNPRMSIEGWFVTSGFVKGEILVTNGAMTLHTLELGDAALEEE